MNAAINADYDLDWIEPEMDEIVEEALPAHDRIGFTFASGIHQSDLLGFLERAQRLAGEVC